MTDKSDLILAALSELKAGQVVMSEDVRKLSGEVTRLFGEFTRLSGEVTRLSGEFTRLSGEVTRQGGEITSLTTSHAKLAEDMTKLRVDVMERMDRLQNSLTSIRDDIATNFGTVDHVRTLNENTREELRALNATMSNLIRKQLRLETEIREMKGDP